MAVRKTHPAFLIIIILMLHLEVVGQNEKAAGYMGLWYKTDPQFEHGYRLSGGMATYSSQHTPMAIYVPEQKKTFFVYCGTSAPDTSHVQIMISYFDHVTHKVPRPVIVLDKMGVMDPQDNATLSIDSGGYIWVFISGRGRTRPGYIFKSELPFSIESFQMAYKGEIVFPQAWWMNDTTFMLMHTKVLKGRELYWTTGRDGKTWRAPQKLAGMGGHFQITNRIGNRLYSVFNVCPDGNLDARTNLYLLYTDDLGRSWKNIDGKEIQTPLIEPDNDALIMDYRSQQKLVYLQDLNFDENGDPVILLLISSDFRPGPAGDPRELVVVSRKGGEWNFSKVCNMPHNNNVGSIYISDEWRIVSPSDEGPAKYGTGGEIVLWVSTDRGATWVKKENITSGSRFNHSHARRPLNPGKDFYAFWSDGDASGRSESHIYFTNEKCDKVWMLPYSMKKDFQRPVRVK